MVTVWPEGFVGRKNHKFRFREELTQKRHNVRVVHALVENNVEVLVRRIRSEDLVWANPLIPAFLALAHLTPRRARRATDQDLEGGGRGRVGVLVQQAARLVKARREVKRVSDAALEARCLFLELLVALYQLQHVAKNAPRWPILPQYCLAAHVFVASLRDQR